MVDINREVDLFFQQVDPRLAKAAREGNDAAFEGLVHGVSLINAEATRERDPDGAPTFEWHPDFEQSIWFPSSRELGESARITAQGEQGLSSEEIDAVGIRGLVDRERGFKPIERFASEVSVRWFLDDPKS